MVLITFPFGNIMVEFAFRGMATMNKAMVLRICAFVVTFAAVLSNRGLITGQDQPKDPLFRGRLPAYYGEIVTEAQRRQIYAVQEKYEKQISPLKEQLSALEKKQEVEIKAILSEEQRAKLKRAQEDGAAKRKKTAEKKAADAKAEAKPAAKK
jgi:hypothetical protein